PSPRLCEGRELRLTQDPLAGPSIAPTIPLWSTLSYIVWIIIDEPEKELPILPKPVFQSSHCDVIPFEPNTNSLRASFRCNRCRPLSIQCRNRARSSPVRARRCRCL